MYVIKPQSSRQSSAEAFVVCLGFQEGAKLSVSDSLDAVKLSQKAIEGKEEESKDEGEDELTF